MNRLTDLLRCELPIQLAPMGRVSATPSLRLAVARAGGHAVHPALALPPRAIAPVLDALSSQTRGFGVNFIVPLMDRGSLELAVERAPHVDFFLAGPTRPSWRSCTTPVESAAGRWSPPTRRAPPRRPDATS